MNNFDEEKVAEMKDELFVRNAIFVLLEILNLIWSANQWRKNVKIGIILTKLIE